MPRSATILVVARWLLSHAGVPTSMADLARELGTSKASVYRAVRLLVASGVARQVAGGRGAGNRTALVPQEGRQGELRDIADGKFRPVASLLSSLGTKRRNFPWSLSEDDFGDAAAIRSAFDRTVAAGFIEASEAALVRFAAAIARARRVARNAAAFVAAFVRGKVPWAFLAAADEDAGRALLREPQPPESPVAVVAAIAARALKRLKDSIMPHLTPKTLNTPDNPDADLGRRIWCYLQDHKPLGEAARMADVAADRALVAVRAHARSIGAEKRLDTMLERTRPAPLKRERAAQ